MIVFMATYSSSLKVYDVPSERLELVRKALTRANKRLAAAGFTDFFSIGISVGYTRLITSNGITTKVERTTLTIHRPLIGYGGYTFLARVEEVGENTGKFVAYTAPGIELLGWRPTSMECEHCHKVRARAKVYVIEDAAGNRKVVGGTCVKLYTGLTPAALWALEWDDVESHNDADWETSGNYTGTKVISGDAILRLAYILVKKFGYRPTSAILSTKDSIIEVVTTPTAFLKREYLPLIAAAEGIDAAILRAKIKGLLKNKSSDWVMNVLSLVDEPYLDYKQVGVLASALKMVVEDEQAEAAAQNWTSEWVTNPGSKVIDLEVTLVEKTSHYESFMGPSVLVYTLVFRSQTGHRIVWKTSRSRLPEVNVPIVIEGKVKKNHEWKGLKTTYVKNLQWWDSPYV